MKSPCIKDVGLAAWIVSCCFPACGAVAAAEAAKAEENVEESANATAEQASGNGGAEPDAAAPDLTPVGEMPEEPATAGDLPPTTLPEKSPAGNVPNDFPEIRPLGESPEFDPSDIGRELSAFVQNPVLQAPRPWLTDPGLIFGHQSAGYAPMGLPSAPSGFTSIAPGGRMPGNGLDGLPAGFSASGAFSAFYNSNVSPGSSSNGSKDDFTLSLGGTLSYMTKPLDWTFGGSYNGSYNQYFSDSELSGYNQGLGLSASYEGEKFRASANLSLSSDEGSNRYYSNDYIRQTSINTSLSLSYLLSQKTSLNANFGQGFYIVDDGGYGDTGSFNVGLNALWRCSPITQLGPGVRYSHSSLDGGEARTSISPEFILNYDLSAKISLNSRIGVEFSEFEDGGSSDPSLTGAIGLSYTPSELWGMNLSLFSGTQADASASGVFTQVNSLRLGYYRKIRQASLGLGLSYEIDTTETSDSAVSSSYPDRNHFGLDASFGMPVFRNSSFASIFTRYNNEDGGNSSSGNSFQIGLSISHTF